MEKKENISFSLGFNSLPISVVTNIRIKNELKEEFKSEILKLEKRLSEKFKQELELERTKIYKEIYTHFSEKFKHLDEWETVNYDNQEEIK